MSAQAQDCFQQIRDSNSYTGNLTSFDLHRRCKTI